MAVFLTGASGYIGSYVAAFLLQEHDESLALLVRAKSPEEGRKRLWNSMQLHMDFDRFASYLPRMEVFLGDLTAADLGLDAKERDRLVRSTDSVIHCAASLNRKSAKACFNVNLRGTLELVKIAQDARDHHGLRRFSDVSTTAVAGHRQDEVVSEDSAIEWDRSDYDPYARTKKFCEHMVHELLPDTPITVFRPSIVLGDSRFPETTQFDMVRAFALLAQLPALPFKPHWRADIVPADYVARAIVAIHQKDEPRHGVYHLSSGEQSLTYREIADCLRRSDGKGPMRFVAPLERPISYVIDALASVPRDWRIAQPAAMMKVFWPYLVFNTVFDNTRVRQEMGESPKPFTDYAYPLLRFAVDGGFRYPYKPWPKGARLHRVA
jgi:thioester reductase-like protein